LNNISAGKESFPGILVYQSPLVDASTQRLSDNELHSHILAVYLRVNFQGISIFEQKDRAFEFWHDSDDDWTVRIISIPIEARLLEQGAGVIGSLATSFVF